MKKILLLVFLFTGVSLFTQETPDSTLTQSVINLQLQVDQQQADINKLFGELDKEYRTYRIVREDLNQKIIDKQKEVIDSLNMLIEKSNQQLFKVNQGLEAKITNTESSTKNELSVLGASINKNKSTWLWALAGIIVIGLCTAFFLWRKIKKSKADTEVQIKNTHSSFEQENLKLNNQISQTRKQLDEESLKLDTKLMEILNKQLKIEQVKPESNEGEKDHSLVLKVADEVTRILMNLEVMDKSIRGYKHLKRYASSILDNLKAYGYEIPELLGENYHSGMNMVATMEFDDNIEEGAEIIKRIIRPQVNYNGKMIQAAKVVVAFND